uniref:Uncharacterized protein n=1 Tax=Rhizophora mucronata TaxID=61149 RepID=A0A2P2PI92_RHIMU
MKYQCKFLFDDSSCIALVTIQANLLAQEPFWMCLSAWLKVEFQRPY